ncbi:hypothetical protein RB623_22975 [Mesorhizobium sp. LHD-90]|uniref:hypothetical protein n=1 Tax=Mesorhizobium sp. LHD-90 TaxID=3071414 RepID=UPI0027DEF955|nr:hypothetical protein [Mesorhizobium sp. LHD-90]MDQ6436924.1 hypothetical protein [Mesorhizobium sp. LHD-90]
MSRKPAKLLSQMLRALLFSAVLAAPVLAMPAFGSDGGSVIEAPMMKKKGAGFVLLVSLQRR